MKRSKLTAIVSAAAMFASMLTPFAAAYADGTTDLYVGADKQYKTISEAVAAAAVINPQSESERVTINVEPGNYEEQVKLDGVDYVTLQQEPETNGTVNLNWYYCTGYCTSNADLDGNYNAKLDWSAKSTWSGSQGNFTEYRVGQKLEGVSSISYYDTDGVLHKDVPVKTTHLGNGTGLDKMAALIVTNKSTDITVKDFNIVNSAPVMVTKGQIDGHLTPEADRVTGVAASYDLPTRNGLTICDENTVPEAPADVLNNKGEVDKNKVKSVVENGRVFTAEESAYLVRSSAFNERGHAIATHSDRITFENVRARGNQDSIYINGGRVYFKDCDLIGGTDYIYGDASAVFDNCKLGAEGMTDKAYGATITAANNDAKNPYGYLFYNCTLYNMLDNFTDSCYGRPWRQEAQITFYKTKLDDKAEIGKSKAGIISEGWHDMSGSKAELARFYEYGTYNASGNAVDTSKRLENANGFGSVLDDWQILEFNPRNYFNSSFWASKGEWDPMNFGEEYLTEVDKAIANANVTVPEGEETTVNLPSAPSGIKFKWQSASSNAVVSADGTKLSVIRPAAGEAPITTTVTLYAMDEKTGMGDKKDVQVVINPTSDTENVFNIPVTINQSTNAKNTYTVTVSKNGALIKQEEIKVNSTVTTANITGIPASADGIDYEVKVVSSSNDFTVTVPEDGITSVKGITGKDAVLNITSNKLIDDTVTLNISATAADGNKTYDLIALAKAAGAEGIENSAQIKVSYDVTVGAKPEQSSYIDISSGTPSNKNSAVSERFSLAKINNSWEQIDVVDNSQGFANASNGDGQCLNITGKFDYTSKAHTVSTLIDYKAGIVTIDGSNSGNGKTATPYTFKGFPETAVKGNLNMGVFSGSASDNWTVSNVKVTYKKLVSGDEPAEPEYKLYKYSYTDIAGGNPNTDGNVYRFTEDADSDAKKYSADEEDSTKLSAELAAGYRNFIGGTGTTSRASIKLNAPAGKYKLYYIGYNHGKDPMTATINGKSYKAEAGVNFAYKESDASRILKSYAIDIVLENEGDEIVFDTADKWIPDLYGIVAVSDDGTVYQMTNLGTTDGTGDSKATYFKITAPITGNITGVDVTSDETTKKFDWEKSVDVSGGVEVVLGLVVDGLADENAAAELIVK